MRQLLEHYFAEQGSQLPGHHNNPPRPQPERAAWQALDNINRMAAEPNSRSMRLICWGCFQRYCKQKAH